MNWYRQWQEAFANLKLAERRLLFIALLLLTPYLLLLWVLEPRWQQLQRQHQQLRQSIGQLEQLNTQSNLLQQALQQDPNELLRQQLASEQQLQQQLSADIRQLTGRYVAAEQMLALLQDVLAQSPGVRLQQLSSQTPQPILLGNTATGASASQTSVNSGQNAANVVTAPTVGSGPTLLYRHITVLTFSGDYHHLQQLLQRMEALPWQLHWRQLDYRVQQHPQAELILQLETFSEQVDYLRI